MNNSAESQLDDMVNYVIKTGMPLILRIESLISQDCYNNCSFVAVPDNILESITDACKQIELMRDEMVGPDLMIVKSIDPDTGNDCIDIWDYSKMQREIINNIFRIDSIYE